MYETNVVYIRLNITRQMCPSLKRFLSPLSEGPYTPTHRSMFFLAASNGDKNIMRVNCYSSDLIETEIDVIYIIQTASDKKQEMPQLHTVE